MSDGAIAIREKAAAKFQEAHDFWTERKDADGNLSAEDESQFAGLMKEAGDLDHDAAKAATHEDQIGSLKDRMEYYHGKATGGAPIPFGVAAQAGGPKSLGQNFVDSEAYSDLKESGALASDRAAFKSQPVKAASDILMGASGATGSALIVPQYLPGVQALGQRPLTVRDLFGSGTTDSDTISYARQDAFDNAAAPVAEATSVSTGAKPQSSIGWERVEEPVESIATWMAATRRLLADAGQVRSLIDNQLRLMLELEVEDQLLNGDGSSPDLTGLLNVAGIQTLDAGSANISNLDAIRRAKRLVKTDGARIGADAIVMHPADGEAVDTMKDDMGRYLGEGPFSTTGPDEAPIWRLRRVESEAIDEGTAIVGAFQVGGTVFQREPITILTADQHADFFVRNLIVILAEERLGFAVYYPASFVELTFSNWPSAS